METIRITSTISIDASELDEQFIRASGPGGQNVNKVASAVQLRFDVRRSRNLPNWMSIRAQAIAGNKLTKDGVIVITANRFRTQEQNREDAINRLVEILQEAANRPVKRKATKPSKGAKERRLKAKKGRSNIKKMRGRPIGD